MQIISYYLLKGRERMDLGPTVDLTAIVAIAALLVTILIADSTAEREVRMRFTDKFDKIYKDTFALRERLSDITRSQYHEEFFYELDRIWNCEQLRDQILDYLTEMENFFFLVVGHRSVQRVFEKLMSLPLYQRLLFFYGFILKQRAETRNPRLFLNYEKSLQIIGRMKKIRNQFHGQTKKCYVGIRSSDCAFDDGYFQSDVCIFSSHADPEAFDIRPNQNICNRRIAPYTLERMDDEMEREPELRFVFYNGMTAYKLPQKYQERALFLNCQALLQSLNNKPEMKRWLAQCSVPILPYETLLGQEIAPRILAAHHPGATRFVIQSSAGGGGVGTFLASPENFHAVAARLQPLRQYLVSAYVEKSVSVNTHVFVSDKQTVLSPGSVQIVLLERDQLSYRGADYVAFRSLPESCRERIRDLSLKLANCLRQRGYRGVAGLDFLVTAEGKVYCVEVNPRFQASSPLLNLYLKNYSRSPYMAHSIFELNEQAFSNRMVTTLCFDDRIDYSCYYYYYDDHDAPLQYAIEKEKILRRGGAVVHTDGFEYYADDPKRLDEDSYLFEAMFPHAISAISPDMTLWLNDNIPVRKAPEALMDLKIALLNQGVRSSPLLERAKKGTYESVDIAYCRDDGDEVQSTPMNCAVGINLSRYSPFSLESDDSGQYLVYYNAPMGRVQIETNRLARLPHTDQRVLYLATDRLRIKLVSGCEYKNHGLGCRFCNLPLSDTRFTRQELEQALTHLKAVNPSFRHILIGGGTCLAPNLWDDVIWLCQYLKQDPYYRDKPISWMAVPPSREVLERLHAAGVEEVAFNVEVVDDEKGKWLMPGKRGQSKAAYYQALEQAVSIFGTGAVRSALLVGIDQEEALVQEVLELARMGVIPCLSALRALPNSDYAGAVHPENTYLRRVYDRCAATLAEAGMSIHELGPKCAACRNNMLTL